jgi:cobalt-zinc-cadmium efflux system protein
MLHNHFQHHSLSHTYNKAFSIGIILNISYVIVEFTYGFVTNSMALIADAGHNLSDVIGLSIAWGASYLAKTTPTYNRTYGLKKTTIVAALLNALILLIAVGAITIESIRKLINPQPVEGTIIITVAAMGVAINAFTAFLFIKGKEKDINIKGVYLHMAADAGISCGVVVAGIIITFSNWLWLDPLVSIVISIIITMGTWRLLKDSFMLSMDAVPNNIDIEKVKYFLLSLPKVKDLHDLHIWGMSTTESALTVHLVLECVPADNKLIEIINKSLQDDFGINHPTIQIELLTGVKNCEKCM